VHKILLNSVLLSPIVSGGVRPTPPPDKHPYVITPLFAAVRGSVGVRTLPRGSDRVRSTGYIVSVFNKNTRRVLSHARCPTAAENRVMTKGGCVRGGLTSVSNV